eukprot:CAMPEP_0114249992 /NCGR_PEP_ID=MMETSP0058-20121206/14455_1 /TAXON_ID=36894 /ORGANISM="Pyramimonas parkeae, CCMP726" /LENGTH=307 /DNA_ID=CAMNT_0001363609 /DNA_START=295 /DNA_END=1218 /DNA_ORIENTATION=-
MTHQLAQGIRVLSLRIIKNRAGILTLATGNERYGTSDLRSQLRHIRAWLDTNGQEVVLLLLEDHAFPVDVIAALQDTGLAALAHTYNSTEPITLGEMISRRERVVVIRDDVNNCTSREEDPQCAAPPWYMYRDEMVQETRHIFANRKELQDATSCDRVTGRDSNPLYLVAHYLTSPDGGDEEVNEWGVLQPRVSRCWRENGRLPNILMVEQFHSSSLILVTNWVNENYQSPLPPDTVLMQPPRIPPFPLPPPSPSPSPPPPQQAPSLSQAAYNASVEESETDGGNLQASPLLSYVLASMIFDYLLHL